MILLTATEKLNFIIKTKQIFFAFRFYYVLTLKTWPKKKKRRAHYLEKLISTCQLDRKKTVFARYKYVKAFEYGKSSGINSTNQ